MIDNRWKIIYNQIYEQLFIYLKLKIKMIKIKMIKNKKIKNKKILLLIL